MKGSDQMKILYVPSGYKNIYTYFDDSIIKAFKNVAIDVKIFRMNHTIEELKSIIHRFQPDVVFTMVGNKLKDPYIEIIKKQRIPMAIWMTEDSFYIDQSIRIVQPYDYIFTIDKRALEVYKRRGYQHVFHLPLGTDTDIFYPREVNEKYKSDICLVGVPYTNRIKHIKYLLKNTSYKIKIVGPNWNFHLNKFRGYPNLETRTDWISPEEVAAYYNGAKIVLNIHRAYNESHNLNKHGVKNKSINNRTFDIAACEAFQLIDINDDLCEHFEDESHIVSFKTKEDLLHKITHYIIHENERITISKQAKNYTIRSHTFEQRIIKLFKIVKEEDDQFGALHFF